MFAKHRLLKNAGMSAGQVIANGVIFFVLYRSIVTILGVASLGTWSVVLAATQPAILGDFGLTGSVVRFIARSQARQDSAGTSDEIQTAAISIGVFFGLLLLCALPLFALALKVLLPEEAVRSGLDLLPYATVALWLNATSSVFLNSLDGLQLTTKRALIAVSGSLFLLGAALFLMPRWGLKGLVWAQIGQNGIVGLFAWGLLRRRLRELPLLPYRWRRRVFGEMARYGVAFQLSSLATLLFDPITKGLLGRFGGIDSVGYFEMANRLVLQVRSVLVSANQTLVPVVAQLTETVPDRLSDLYRDVSRMLTWAGLPLYACLAGAAPFVSLFWIGRFEGQFVWFVCMLVVGWSVNTVSGIAYFANVGSGQLRWNVYGQVLTGMLNAGLGYFLGSFAGATGVVFAWSLALAVGGGAVVANYHRIHRMPLSELWPSETNALALWSGLNVLVSLSIFFGLRDRLPQSLIAATVVSCYCGMVMPAFWRHPSRARLSSWLARARLRLL